MPVKTTDFFKELDPIEPQSSNGVTLWHMLTSVGFQVQFIWGSRKRWGGVGGGLLTRHIPARAVVQSSDIIKPRNSQCNGRTSTRRVRWWSATPPMYGRGHRALRAVRRSGLVPRIGSVGVRSPQFVNKPLSQLTGLYATPPPTPTGGQSP